MTIRPVPFNDANASVGANGLTDSSESQKRWDDACTKFNAENKGKSLQELEYEDKTAAIARMAELSGSPEYQKMWAEAEAQVDAEDAEADGAESEAHK